MRVSSGEVFLIQTGALDQTMPRLNNRLSILSPFDNSVIQRDRLKSLFQYDYQIECYVPEAKRQFGYFCLPLLYRGEFIGRMDCKAHRKEGRLEIKALHFEQSDFKGYLFKNCNLDEEALISALSDAIAHFCQFQQCETVSLTKVHPEHLAVPLKAALLNID